jgi:hypothetical protein
MEDPNLKPPAEEEQKKHKKKCGFCPLGNKCPVSGKPYVCAGIVLAIIFGVNYFKG